MSAFDIIVSLLRGIHVAATVSLAGTLLFLLVVLPSAPVAQVARTQRILVSLVRISAAAGLVLGIGWLTTETVTIADADSVMLTLQALPVVAFHTQFGQWLLIRFGLLLLVLITPRLGGAPLVTTLALAGAALALQPILGHAGAAGGTTGDELIVSEALHLLAAGAWLGGLLPLFISVGILPRDVAATACRNFTPIGLSAVLLLAGTALVQISELMGGMPGLFGTNYGHIALIKLGVFFILLTLAALNRLVLTERVAESSRFGPKIMRLSVAIEIALGSLVVITAAFLASRTPGTHDEPVWPFAWRPSLIAFQDLDLRRELVFALIGVAMGVICVIVAIFWRRYRWISLGAAILTLALSFSHLDLLFIAAYPTSFFASPTEFAATAIMHGADLFAANCTPCHGTEGRGDGPMAKSLPVLPADLTAAHFRAHSDGELYWFISHGFTTFEGVPEMPGFVSTLSSEAIWDLIDYLHAHNAGATRQATGQWPVPVAMPQFDALCPSGQDLDLDDLRGRPMLILTSDITTVPQLSNASTIVVTRDPRSKPAEPLCVAGEPQVWDALSIILGVSPDALSGTEILVDANGWLRLVWHPGDPENWSDPHVLEAKLQDIAAHPLVITPPGGHIHHQG